MSIKSEQEIWKRVDEVTEAHAEVSSLGRVKVNGVIVREVDDNKRQLYIRGKMYSVPRMVMRAFKPVSPGEESRHIDRLDGNMRNCSVDNLQWHLDRYGKNGSKEVITMSVPVPENPTQGDKVLIVKPERSRDREHWLYGMDKYVGRTMTIREITRYGDFQLEEDAAAGDGGMGEGFLWPSAAVVPIPYDIPLRRGKQWKVGDYVRSITDNYKDCPKGWMGYVEFVNNTIRPGLMLVGSYGTTHWVRQVDFARPAVPSTVKVGDSVTITDKGKLHPRDIDWFVRNNVPAEYMCRFAFGMVPGTDFTMKCQLTGHVVYIGEEDGPILVQVDDGLCYLVDREGMILRRGKYARKV